MKYVAVIVGGGSGTRMGAVVPKQFLMLDKKPVLMHTIQAFFDSDLKPEIILVLNIDFHQYWEQLCLEHQFAIPHTVIKGGRQRFYSVKNAFKYIKGQAIVAIHDGVRPLVSNELITNSFLQAEVHGNAVCAVQSSDSVRMFKNGSSEAIKRDQVFLVQTPQAFDLNLLKNAYKQPYHISFTDDASVVERAGAAIHLIEGDKKNIKITYPEDIRIAEATMGGK